MLFVIANFLVGEPGSGTAGPAVVKYYHVHQTTETIGVFAVAFAVVALTFFLASLRRTLSATDEGRYLANVVTAGGAVYAAGLMVMTALTVALVDAGKNNMPGTAQTLNVLSSDMWLPVVVGLALLGLGTGVAALRSATLPKWLGHRLPVRLFKYDDFQLWVTDSEGNPAAVTPVGARGSGIASVHVQYATPGSQLAQQKLQQESVGEALILPADHPLAKQAFQNT